MDFIDQLPPHAKPGERKMFVNGVKTMMVNDRLRMARELIASPGLPC
jgi:hypothetical protein